MRRLGGAVALALLIAGCPPDQLDPSPPLTDEGHTGADNPLLSDDPPTCRGRLEHAADHVQRALEEAMGGCSEDDDCTTLVPETSCFAACEEAVAHAGVAGLRRALADAEERWCHGFELDCPGARRTPDRCHEGPVRCVGGECRRVTP